MKIDSVRDKERKLIQTLFKKGDTVVIPLDEQHQTSEYVRKCMSCNTAYFHQKGQLIRQKVVNFLTLEEDTESDKVGILVELLSDKKTEKKHRILLKEILQNKGDTMILPVKRSEKLKVVNDLSKKINKNLKFKTFKCVSYKTLEDNKFFSIEVEVC